ncbi:TPA: LOW QUALITY PROTEIN: hypothetical protein N0F65_009020 [Lagenidium giganteum]|uniref:Uncharacterized protein n=1 Tax=Lagenidium giganteum TaxID=4803 RepID=A0AAV2YUF4_9STRA|nr:TPA: LOW QUALITY PROTEIN: hypothetical protein N0F65_009020 [Lagenidium giganteum]
MHLSEAIDLEEEDDLKKAARAGILLLEKNEELHAENTALRTHLEVAEQELATLRSQLRTNKEDLEKLREERKQSLVEVNALRGELRIKANHVTDALDRESKAKAAAREAELSNRRAEQLLDKANQEIEELQRRLLEITESGRKEPYAISNPASLFDSNQAPVFTAEDYEELLRKWQDTSDANDSLNLEVKSLKKDLETWRFKAAKVGEYKTQLDQLEKKNQQLLHAKTMLEEEQLEERAVINSLRSMNLMYKQIADSRPFSMDCTCAVHPIQDGAVSVQDDLLHTNSKLANELKSLRSELSKCSSLADASDDGFEVDTYASESRQSSRSNSDTMSLSGDVESAQEEWGQKVRDLREQLSVTKDMLKRVKQQWSAALESQKAVEECNKAAQEEIASLRQALDFQMATTTRVSMCEEGGERLAERMSEHTPVPPSNARSNVREQADDDEDEWFEEHVPYPAPPGDLNSPLIKCLLDHWTTDKSKIMHLTDWLHNAIRGTGKASPLRLENLSSEVAAGFAQLLVPILREKHGVTVRILRRDSMQVLSDLVLQTNAPPSSQTSFTTTGNNTSVSSEASVPKAPKSLGARMDGNDSNANDENHERNGPSSWPRRRFQESRFLKGETQFLYG